MKKLLALTLLLMICILTFASCIEGKAYVIGASYDEEGNLILEYSDGRTHNVGKVNQAEDDGLEYFPLPDGTYAVSKGSTEFLEEITIPSTHAGKPVTKIAEKAFEGSENLKKVTISEGIQVIDKNAFSNCSSLEAINVPNTVTTISMNAFAQCAALKEIIIPKSVVNMGNSVFSGCKSLKIYCEYTTCPTNWKFTWRSTCPITWGYVAEQ